MKKALSAILIFAILILILLFARYLLKEKIISQSIPQGFVISEAIFTANKLTCWVGVFKVEKKSSLSTNDMFEEWFTMGDLKKTINKSGLSSRAQWNAHRVTGWGKDCERNQEVTSIFSNIISKSGKFSHSTQVSFSRDGYNQLFYNADVGILFYIGGDT
jgi:hypothetical protein